MKVILIGSGKIVYFLAKQFINKNYYLTLIAEDEKEAIALSRQLSVPVLVGNGSNPITLKEAQAYQADLVLSLTPRDEDNLVACQIAQKQYGVKRTIALVNDPEHQAIFQQLGITFAFSATQILANIIENRAYFEDVESFFSVAEGQVTVTEITLPEDSPVINKTLQELNLSGETLIACIIRKGSVTIPRGQNRLQGGDRLLLISQVDHYEQSLKILTGDDG